MRRADIAIVVVTVLAFVGCSGGEETMPPPELTEEYGCGHGFYLGNGEQTAGLFIISPTGFGEDVPAGRVDLDASGWTAELRFGSDLFANWCDDVMEPGEPEPVVDEIWEVSGVLEIGVVPPGAECGLATAILEGAVARSDRGEEISLDDLEMNNELWGCFAG